MKNTFAEKIIELRHVAKITQARLAKMLGITQNRVSDFERGTGGPSSPKIRKLIEIGKKHGIEFTFDDFLSIGTKQGNNRTSRKAS